MIFENTESPMKRYEQQCQPRWYERERWPYQADCETVNQAAKWLKQVDWKLFCTFTFPAWRVPDERADKTFATFVNHLERAIKSDIAYVRGDEKNLASGSRSESGRHFHVLLTSLAPLNPTFVSWLWTETVGNRSDDASAEVEPYNPARKGPEYVLKYINNVNGGWKVGKLELFHPEARGLQDMTKRFRRRLRRHKVRQQKFGTLNTVASVASLQGE